MVFDKLQAELDLDASGFEQGVNDAQGKIDSLGSKTAQVGSKMQSAGSTMTRGVTAPLAAMGGASVKAAADFEQNMQNSISVMGDVDKGMRENLEQSAREVAKSTTKSHNEAAESFYFLASAGLDAQESLAAMPKVAAFAEAGQMDMAEATDTATNVMSAYGMEAKNIDKVTDTMTGTVTAHNQTMQGMSEAFKNAAPAAASMGIKIDELAAATGMLGDVGIQGAEAGTALNSIMRRMAKRTGQAGMALDEMGVKTRDAQGNLLPLAEIIGQLEEKNMSAAQASKIFGRQQSAGMALVSQGSDALKENTKRIKESEGATQKMADTQRNTLHGSMQLLKSSVTDLAISFGDVLAPEIAKVADKVTKLTQKFKGLSETQQKLVVGIAALAAALGPILLVLGTLLKIVGPLIPAIKALGAVIAGLSTPVLLIVGLIALLAAAYATNLGGMREKTNTVFGFIMKYIVKTMGIVKNIVTRVVGVMNSLWNSHGSTVVGVVTRIITVLLGAFQKLLSAILPIVKAFVQRARQFFAAFGPKILQIVRNLVLIVTTVFRKLLSVVLPIVKTFIGLVQTAWQLWGDKLIAVAKFIFDTVFAALGVFIDIFLGATRAFLALVQGDWSGAWNAIKGIFQTIVTAIVNSAKTAFAVIKTVIRTAWNVIKALTKAAWNLIKTVIKTALGIVKTVVTGAFNAIKQIIKTAWNLIKTLTKTVWNAIKKTIRAALNAAKAFIRAAFNAIKQTITTVWNAIKQTIKTVLNAIKQTITTVWNAIKQTITTVLNAVKKTVFGIFNAVKTRIFTRLDQIKSKVFGIFNAVKTRIFTRLDQIKSKVFGIMDAVKDKIFTRLGQIKDEFFAVMDAVKDKIFGTLGQIKDEFVGKMGDVKDDVESKMGAMKDKVVTTVSNMASGMLDEVQDLPGDFKQAGKDAMNSLADGIRSRLNDVKNAAGSVGSAVRSRLPGSDAEKGPLSDLTDASEAIPAELVAGMHAGESDVSNEAEILASAVTNATGPTATGSPAEPSNSNRMVIAELRKLRSTIETMEFELADDGLEVGEDGMLRFVDARIETKREDASKRAFSRANRGM